MLVGFQFLELKYAECCDLYELREALPWEAQTATPSPPGLLAFHRQVQIFLFRGFFEGDFLELILHGLYIFLLYI